MADIVKKEVGMLVAEEKEFTNSKNEKIKYVDFSVNCDGIIFRFYPKADDKKLLNYVLGL